MLIIRGLKIIRVRTKCMRKVVEINWCRRLMVENGWMTKMGAMIMDKAKLF